MALDDLAFASELAAAAGVLAVRRAAEAARGARARTVFAAIDMERVRSAVATAGKALTMRVALPLPGSEGRKSPIPAPTEYVVAAVDGSSTEVDRHAAVAAYVFNVGTAIIRYGPNPSASISSAPRLFAGEDEVFRYDSGASMERRTVDGQVLALERGILELRRLVEIAEAHQGPEPLLALMDGPLAPFGLAVGQRSPEARSWQADRLAREWEGLLGRVDAACARGPVVAAGYISKPGSYSVANLVRVSACPFPSPRCAVECRDQADPSHDARRCNDVGTIDRTVLADALRPGGRTGLFANHLATVAIPYFFTATSSEIARIEVPPAMADTPGKTDLVHALVLDQAARGLGYPVALMEAHEAAVLGAADRRAIALQLAELQGAEGVSAKEASKRSRFS